MFVMAMELPPIVQHMNHNPMVPRLMKHPPIHLLHMLPPMCHQLAVSVKEHSSLSSHPRVIKRMESRKMDVIVVLATYHQMAMELQSQAMVLLMAAMVPLLMVMEPLSQVMEHLVEDSSLVVVDNKKV